LRVVAEDISLIFSILIEVEVCYVAVCSAVFVHRQLHWVFIVQILGWNVMMERYVISVFEPGMICRSRRQEFAEIPVAQTSTKRYITFTITTRITIVALLS
jgi:hypothetical protein